MAVEPGPLGALQNSIAVSLFQALTCRRSTTLRSSLLGLKKGILFGGTSTLAPVFGLRPMRPRLGRVGKLPKPAVSTLAPDPLELTLRSNIAQSASTDSFRRAPMSW